MTTKEALESRLVESTTAAELAAVAREAGALDADLAHRALEQAEMRCQMPAD